MDLLKWLMKGDPSIQYMVSRDLFEIAPRELDNLQRKVHEIGWCKDLLKLRDPDTYKWGNGVYGPKWISTTYTMLDLKNFGVDPSQVYYQESCQLIIDDLWVNRSPKKDYPLDLCICGMILNLACYGKVEHRVIPKIVDTLLRYHMDDGGWNCRIEQSPHHSSLHTTINVLEGFLEYKNNDYTYRLAEVDEACEKAHEFILCHHLFKSDKTQEIISKQFTMLSYPPRWKYDVLRALDYFQKAMVPFDSRMEDSIELIKKKRRKDGTWPVQQKYSGLIHFDYEKTGGPSRINTLRVLRVFKYYGIDD